MTWEIWGLQRGPDLNRDGKVNLLDFAIFASVWDTQKNDADWNTVCDIALPCDDHINEADLAVICSNWMLGCSEGLEEGFESGDFSSYPWTHSGDVVWQVVSDSAAEGTYSARSGSITDSQQSNLEIEIDVEGTQITFSKKVSSEDNYDYLRFYIDGLEIALWSGQSDWLEVSYPVTAGQHIFKWAYTKDIIFSSYSDCAWVDDIRIE